MPAVDEMPPVSIAVTPEGVAESWLLRELGLTCSQVHPLHGDVIGCPRHYRYRHGQYFYTADGVRALAEHFGRRVAIATAHSAPVPQPRPPEPQFWWQKDNA